MAQKVNITIGRFQPFTQGHLNMILEGELPCIIYRINSSKKDEDSNILKTKISSKTIKKDNVKNVLAYLNGEDIKLTEFEKEILKRPFTNELIEKELDIVKRSYKKYFVDIIYVKNAYEAIADFNAKVSNNEYESNFLMCGDDRIENYKSLIQSDKPFKHTDGQEYENVLKDKLEVNTGKGRTEGVSGTAVRNAIIHKDKGSFSKIMPTGTDSMFDEFVNAFETFKNKLQTDINESFMSLKSYLIENIIKQTPININMINEGGAGGHMSHPFEYTDFTGEDLLELVDSLFNGKIENVKEKLDGMNINATMNNDGEVVFVRNNTDRNSDKGGITLNDIMTRWDDKPHVQKTYMTAGRIIDEIFKKLPVKYFNPEKGKRKIINCECIIEGKTNVMPYATDRVAFHGYKIYEITDKLDKYGQRVWAEIESVEGDVDAIYKAAEGIDKAKPRANLIVKSVEDANKFAKDFKLKLANIYKNEKLDMTATIEEWKRARFESLKPDWLDKEVDAIYNRWFNNDKSFKAANIKKLYSEHYSDIMGDKLAKEYIKEVMEPMDEIFMAIGNAFIKVCNGFTNQDKHGTIVDTIKADLDEVIRSIDKDGSEEHKADLERNMNRLKSLGEDYINSAEGVVFMYKDKLMKLTGSFAAINQILGLIRFNR